VIGIALGDQPLPWGLVGICVLLIIFGGLIPRWTHTQRIKDKDELIKRLTAALDHRDAQFDTLTGQWGTIVKLLEDIKKAGDRTESRHPS
jgi:hypothetical protein